MRHVANWVGSFILLSAMLASASLHAQTSGTAAPSTRAPATPPDHDRASKLADWIEAVNYNLGLAADAKLVADIDRAANEHIKALGLPRNPERIYLLAVRIDTKTKNVMAAHFLASGSNFRETLVEAYSRDNVLNTPGISKPATILFVTARTRDGQFETRIQSIDRDFHDAVIRDVIAARDAFNASPAPLQRPASSPELLPSIIMTPQPQQPLFMIDKSQGHMPQTPPPPGPTVNTATPTPPAVPDLSQLPQSPLPPAPVFLPPLNPDPIRPTETPAPQPLPPQAPVVMPDPLG